MKTRLVKLKSHNSVYVKIVVLNLIFTLLFSSILLFNSQYLKNSVKENLNQTNKDSLLDISGDVDQQLHKLKQSVYSLSLNMDMVALNKSDPNAIGYKSTLIRFNQKLNELSRLLPFESSIFVYFKDKGFVTSADGSRQLDLFYEKLSLQSADFSCDCLHLIDQSETFQNYDRFMTYVYPIHNVGSVIVKIDKSGLERDLRKSAQVLDNMIWITTESGDMVAGNSRLTPELKQQLQSDAPSLVIDGKTYSSFHLVLNGFKYTVLYPESVLQQKISQANQYTLLLFLVFLTISIGLLLANMTIYKPIKSTITSLNSSNQMMKQTLHEQNMIMEQNALLRLASDTPQDIPPVILEALHARYNNGYILTVYIEADRGTDIEQAYKKLEQQLFQQYHVHKLMHRLDAGTYLIHNTIPIDLSGELPAILESIASEGFFIMCGISGYMTDIRNLHQAIGESTQAIEHDPYNWEAPYHIANFTDQSVAQETSFALSIGKEQELIAYVLKGNQESLRQFFSGTVRNVMKRMTYQDIRTLHRYFNDLFHVILSSKKIKTTELDESLKADLSTIRNPELVHIELFRKYNALAAHAINQDLTLYEKIVNLIDQNYNRDLSLTAIADQFNITSVYLSTYFKKNSGYNITHYIKNVRMNKALKQFEENPHMTIKEIADRVGYCSEQTFTRHFKKIFGTTPALYLKSPSANVR
ncbi:helix-turn-helix domain-containing protein [Paenibacillus mendelii]|uniref:Helix-turn-helix domain-containing protein n=1 Tax=Paenibacillus mendelii TaxID=206163 RepID=A0ABV6J4D9_9BACL|nr:AraC family transcriptional regulator [Paenibacillus mendelii]MCQ6561728.1 AraC family transcriptional regulator [Paenibacillus mendelii]